ncbi:MAG: hypothetical protein WA081_23520 [Desulfosalsimonadaceae bacterium]
MSKPVLSKLYVVKPEKNTPDHPARFNIEQVAGLLGIKINSSDNLAASLPYVLGDVTMGCENELQTAVAGPKEDVDLPKNILESNFYQNILNRAAAGETSEKLIRDFEEHINNNPENIWENSWVRFPQYLLNDCANKIFHFDVLADKQNPDGPNRTDMDRFLFFRNTEPWIRVPVSYLLRLSLADATGDDTLPSLIRQIGGRYIEHFLNDNTSPETFSFYPIPMETELDKGKGIAKETLIRYLLCQCLIAYANQKFDLVSYNQKAIIYFAPNPPIRQKTLNSLISDSFYRELFMSPCLSGWDRGEEKYTYMHLCHQVMSRSQLNAVKKLKEANIITNNLVVLPNISNISLANNGTHLSIGSRKISALLQAGIPEFTEHDEKYIGDLAIKVVEHFLPLFVGTYSAAPYRLDFSDFHPEKALGFLPHELDFTHLRMIWRRWKKKADLKIFGQPVTPFGPELLDKAFSSIFRLKGDFVHDFRLIDYFMSVKSTDRSPALDGNIGNDIRLKKDLAALGVFDNCMSLYLLYKNRPFSNMGFSGFEGRHYSLFENITEDMGDAANLQILITALAFKYIINKDVSHFSIPDAPTLESERRQIFFGSAIGIPTFYIHKKSKNRFMQKIIKKTVKTRLSRRYPGYYRIYHHEYKKALVNILKEDAADLIEMMGLETTMENLSQRIESWSNCSAAAKLTRGILNETRAKSPMALPAQGFNAAAEQYYRHTLRKQHMNEAFDQLMTDALKVDSSLICGSSHYHQSLKGILDGNTACQFVKSQRKAMMNNRITTKDLQKTICFLILSIHGNQEHAQRYQQTGIKK